MSKRFDLPDLGVGLGLRTVHYSHIVAERPAVAWFEILSENYMQTSGRPLDYLDAIAGHYPIAMHGVSMSIGSTDPLDLDYLAELKALRDRVGALWVSDHLCWTGVAGKNTHDLLPVPYTEEALAHVTARVRAGAGLPRRAARAREPVDVHGVRRRRDARVGVPRAPRRGRRLRALARREQYLRILPESRLRSDDVPRPRAVGAGGAVPRGRAHRSRHAHRRHAHRSGDRSGVGAARRRPPARRRRVRACSSGTPRSRTSTPPTRRRCAPTTFIGGAAA